MSLHGPSRHKQSRGPFLHLEKATLYRAPEVLCQEHWTGGPGVGAGGQFSSCIKGQLISKVRVTCGQTSVSTVSGHWAELASRGLEGHQALAPAGPSGEGSGGSRFRVGKYFSGKDPGGKYFGLCGPDGLYSNTSTPLLCESRMVQALGRGCIPVTLTTKTGHGLDVGCRL